MDGSIGQVISGTDSGFVLSPFAVRIFTHSDTNLLLAVSRN